jgi:hypothetical protein
LKEDPFPGTSFACLVWHYNPGRGKPFINLEDELRVGRKSPAVRNILSLLSKMATFTSGKHRKWPMSNYPTLKNPPIVEAILDVQVIFPQGVELSALAGLHENFQSDYPQKNEERIVQFGFEHQAGEPPKALAQDQGVRGYRFISEDGKQIVQCRKDGFTFNLQQAKCMLPTTSAFRDFCFSIGGLLDKSAA